MMRPIQNLFIFTISLVFLAACTNSASEQSANTSPANDNQSSEEKNLASVVDQYLLLKDALVTSSPEESQAKAMSMLEVIDATNMMGVQQSAKQIATVTDLDTQRMYFDSLSVHLYELLETQDGGNKTLYKQYCPMAFNDRGAYWLSNAEEIRNPYFGDDMLKCGRVEETIKF
ncbi:DUF3347 domain-containing protein [Tunicatimonas pelagia]|uniref:DUF3347 domain-containing protein n=1 Tax=Tunicatimonas pelagia TaxID=931531 RepID=UPI002665F53D|nr:DUF3347 domain-containing protein [Tunicatimonas pelagia]WKN40772.1 DUF3347 domain-containing protein [Tunicatimonas pelagia]